MGKGKGKLPKITHLDAKNELTSQSENNTINDYSPESIFYDIGERVLAFIIFLTSAAVYIYTMYPGLPAGDSGELMSTAKDFGVAHPPGYPLFTTMAALMIKFFPVGTTAWKLNLMSATIGAITNVIMYLNVKRFSNSDAAGLLATGWCGFSRVFWMWNIQGEVFSFNNFFTTMIMYAAWRFANADGQNGKFFEAKLGALICGLALSNQHTSLFYTAPTALWVLLILYKNNLFNFSSLTQVGLRGLAGLTPYLQLPISSFFFNARVSWGDHRLFSDLKRHLLREDFGTFRLINNNQRFTFGGNFNVYFADSCSELTIVVWILVPVAVTLSLFIGSYKQRELMFVYSAMFGTYCIVFCSLANIKDPEGLMHGVLERFWLQPSIALCTIAGCGVGMIFSFVRKERPWYKYLFLSASVLAVAFQMRCNYHDCNENDNEYFWHFSRHVLPELPQGSILLTSGDMSTNTFRYHTIGEEYRTDVMVMDVQFMQYNWFYSVLTPVNWPNVTLPGKYRPGNRVPHNSREYFNLKKFLDANFDRFPIYMCLNVPEHENSIIGYYEAWPYGLCKKFVRLSDNPDILEHLKNIPTLDLEKFPLPDPDRYEAKTWEYSLLFTMIGSFCETPRFLWNKANSLPLSNMKLKKIWYERAHEIMVVNRKHIFDMVEKGKVTQNIVHVMSPLEKQLGHLSLILYSMETDPARKARREEECRMYWNNYVYWHKKDMIGIAEDTMWDTIQNILSNPDFTTLRVLM